MSVNLKNIIAVSAFIGSQIGHADELLRVSALNDNGFNQDFIVSEFQRKVGVQIQLDDSLKVSAENEGKNIRFQTLDNFSVLVPLHLARFPFNKDGG